MDNTHSMTTEMMTGEREDYVPSIYSGVWGNRVKTSDGLGVVMEIDPHAERDILVTLKDGTSLWYALNEVELV